MLKFILITYNCIFVCIVIFVICTQVDYLSMHDIKKIKKKSFFIYFLKIFVFIYVM